MKTSLSLLVLGSLAAPCLALADPNLVLNGSFENGYSLNSSDFSDVPASWLLTPAADNQGVVQIGGTGSSNLDLGVPAEDGNDWLAFGATGTDLDSISQNVATTAGTTYTLSFWVDTDLAAGTPMELAASWDGTDVLDLTSPLSQGGWNVYSYAVTGSGPDAVSFSGLDNNGYLLLDNVQVQAVSAAVPDAGPGVMLTAGVLLALACASRRTGRTLALLSE